MSAILYIGTFLAGFMLGAGAMLLYFQYSIYRQAGNMQEQFKQIQELHEQESGLEMDLEASEAEVSNRENNHSDKSKEE